MNDIVFKHRNEPLILRPRLNRGDKIYLLNMEWKLIFRKLTPYTFGNICYSTNCFIPYDYNIYPPILDVYCPKNFITGEVQRSSQRNGLQ